MDESKRGKKRYWLASAIVLFLVIAFFVGKYILYVSIKKSIENELVSLQEQDILVAYDHFEVYPIKGKIEFVRLRVNVGKDSGAYDGLNATIPYVLIKGVDVIPFLKNNTLSIHKVLAEDAAIVYESGSSILNEQNNKKRKISIENIAIENISFPGIDLYVTEKDRQDTLAHLLTNIEMEDLFLKKQLDSMVWQRGEIHVSNAALKTYKDQYGFSAKRMKVNVADRTVTIDSFRAKPVLGKVEYMRFIGKQYDYIDALLPELRISGINWFAYPRPALMVDQVTTQFYINLYRDKRFPFREVNDKKLPSHMLQRLPFELNVDTLLVKKSYVRYEEHPEDGDAPGSVFFDDLYATIRHLHNIPRFQQNTTMNALARFMGNGKLDAYFTFPYDTTARYTVSGSLENMSLSLVNSMLVPAAKAKIERGLMKKLSFDFSYTPAGSTGEVMLDYDDLKVLTLRTGANNEQKVSQIKTLLLNTFIIKTNMNEDMEEDKRTGTISFERDPLRSVFNLWWKSILSGVKSAYNLDKLPLNSNKEKDEDEDEKDGKKKKGIKGIFSRIF